LVSVGFCAAFIYGSVSEFPCNNAETTVPDDPSINFVIDTEIACVTCLNSWASLVCWQSGINLDGNQEPRASTTKAATVLVWG